MAATVCLHPTVKTDLRDLCYYCCSKCEGLFPTVWEMRAHKALCSGVKVLDDRVHLYAYESMYLDKFLQCCATCTHIKTCPFLLQDAPPTKRLPVHQYFNAIRALLQNKRGMQTESHGEALRLGSQTRNTLHQGSEADAVVQMVEVGNRGGSGGIHEVGDGQEEKEMERDCPATKKTQAEDQAEAKMEGDSQVHVETCDGEVEKKRPEDQVEDNKMEGEGEIECESEVEDLNSISEICYISLNDGEQSECSKDEHLEGKDSEGQVSEGQVEEAEVDEGSEDEVEEVEVVKGFEDKGEEEAEVEEGSEDEVVESEGEEGPEGEVEEAPEVEESEDEVVEPEVEEGPEGEVEEEDDVEKSEAEEVIEVEDEADVEGTGVEEEVDVEVGEDAEDEQSIMGEVCMDAATVDFGATTIDCQEVECEVVFDDMIMAPGVEQYQTELECEIVYDDITMAPDVKQYQPELECQVDFDGLINAPQVEQYQTELECEVVYDDITMAPDIEQHQAELECQVVTAPEVEQCQPELECEVVTMEPEIDQCETELVECEVICDDITMITDVEQCEPEGHTNTQLLLVDVSQGLESVVPLHPVKCRYQLKDMKHSIESAKKSMHLYVKAIPIQGLTLGVTMYYVCDQCDFKTTHPDSFTQHLAGKEEYTEKVNRKQPLKQVSWQGTMPAETPHGAGSLGGTGTQSVKVKNAVQSSKPTKQYRCEMCSSDFPTKYRLNIHLLKHKDEPYRCPLAGCNYQSVHKWKLKAHRKATHLHQNPFSTKVHRDRPASAKTAQYACDECGFTCVHREAIASHLMDHRGLELWQCAECGFSNHAKAVVLRHVKEKHAEYSHATHRDLVVKLGQTLDVDVEAYRIHKPVRGANINKAVHPGGARSERLEMGVKCSALLGPGVADSGEVDSVSDHHLETIDLNCMDNFGAELNPKYPILSVPSACYETVQVHESPVIVDLT